MSNYIIPEYHILHKLILLEKKTLYVYFERLCDLYTYKLIFTNFPYFQQLKNMY